MAGWGIDNADRVGLLDVVRHFKPTILIGASGQPNTFTQQVVETMHQGCARPIVLALSNPTSRIEALPQEILEWTNGDAIVATGSPFAPVRVRSVTHGIGQCNNVFVFPGIGLGATAVGARSLPDSAFAAAARAVYESTERTSAPGATIFPPLSRLRDVSHAVALAVGRALVDAGAAPALTPDEIAERVAASMWEPVYLRYRAD